MSMGHGAVVMWAHVPHGAHEHQGLSCVVACLLGSLAWVRCFRAWAEAVKKAGSERLVSGKSVVSSGDRRAALPRLIALINPRRLG